MHLGVEGERRGSCAQQHLPCRGFQLLEIMLPAVSFGTGENDLAG